MSQTKPRAGVTMAELNAKTGTGKQQIYRWIRAGLLPGPSLRGRGARYDEAYVERVATIADLLRQGLIFEQIRQRLAPPVPPGPGEAGLVALADSVANVPAAERWERLVLLPGLELSFRADGGAVLRRLAGEIWRQFGAAATPAGEAFLPVTASQLPRSTE